MNENLKSLEGKKSTTQGSQIDIGSAFFQDKLVENMGPTNKTRWWFEKYSLFFDPTWGTDPI